MDLFIYINRIMREDNGAMKHLNNTEQSEQTVKLNNTLKTLTNAVLGMKDAFVKGYKHNASARDMVRNDDKDDAKFKKSLLGSFSKFGQLLKGLGGKGFFGPLLAGLGMLMSKLMGGFKSVLFGMGRLLFGPMLLALKAAGSFISKGLTKIISLMMGNRVTDIVGNGIDGPNRGGTANPQDMTPDKKKGPRRRSTAYAESGRNMSAEGMARRMERISLLEANNAAVDKATAERRLLTRSKRMDIVSRGKTKPRAIKKILSKAMPNFTKAATRSADNIAAKVAKSTAKNVAVKAGTKAALKVGLTTTAGAAQSIPVVGQIIGAAIMVGFAAVDAVAGWNNAAEILGKEYEDPSKIPVMDKLKAAALGAVSGLLFGIITPKDLNNLITKDFDDPEVTDGISTSIGNWFGNIGDVLMDFVANFDIGEIIDGFSTKIQNMIEGISTKFKTSIFPMITSMVSNPQVWIGIGKAILGALMLIGKVVISAFEAIFWSIPKAILNIAGSIVALVFTVMSDMIVSIGEGLGVLLYKVVSKIPGAARILGITPTPAESAEDKKEKDRKKVEAKLLKDKAEQQKIEKKLLDDKVKLAKAATASKNGGVGAPITVETVSNGDIPKVEPAVKLSQADKKRKALEDKITAENTFDIQKEMSKNKAGTVDQQMAQVFMNFLLKTFAPTQAELIAAATQGGKDLMDKVPLRIVNPLT